MRKDRKPRKGVGLLVHRMNEEQSRGYKAALQAGARKTAARIRTGEFSLGPALVHACREVGTPKVVAILASIKNGEWSMCAIRYAPNISSDERILLRQTLSDREKEHALFARQFRHLTDEEKSILLFILDHGAAEGSL